MPDKKSDSGKFDKSTEEQSMERRIDAMLSTEGPSSTDATYTVDKAADTPAPGIREPKTAPKLPAKLQEDMEPSTVYKPKIPAQPPIVMALADEGAAEEAPVPSVPKDDNSPELTPETSDVPSVPIDDSATDKAVDDIIASESDKLLAIDDALAARQHKVVNSNRSSIGWKDKLRALAKNKWTWVGLAIILGIIFGLPATRYKVLGLAFKKPVTITVLDSKTNTPVSSAEVQLAGDHAKTDANGQAHLHSAVGPHNLVIQKQYYKSSNSPFFVGFKTSTKPAPINLVATGRLVPITVINKITGKAVSGVEVKVLATTAKTNTKGQALVSLPANTSNDSAKLSLSDYNTADIAIQVTDQALKANTFEITPAGHLYYLSNLSGNIDVVKANLDGSGRKTILGGTGKEDPNTTSLLASRDWHYLVLKSRRDSAQPALYLIDTSTDKVTQFDNSGSDFKLVGWYGHSFIYNLTKTNLSIWQPAREILKSYDAENLQLNQLDQNQAEGDANGYAQQDFSNFYIVNGAVTYTTQWYTYKSGGLTYDTTGKTDTIRAVQPNGQNKKDYQSLPTTTGYIQAALYEPQAVYYSVYNSSDNKTTYYAYEDQAVKTVDVDVSSFNKSYPTFLLSPTGNQTFWTELRDGKNTLFTGDANAQSKKQIASLSDFSPYGWYSDAYVLVSKNSSELYIMSSSGLSSNQQPIKITDYYKPAQTFNGYGYGYGGL